MISLNVIPYPPLQNRYPIPPFERGGIPTYHSIRWVLRPTTPWFAAGCSNQTKRSKRVAWLQNCIPETACVSTLVGSCVGSWHQQSGTSLGVAPPQHQLRSFLMIVSHQDDQLDHSSCQPLEPPPRSIVEGTHSQSPTNHWSPMRWVVERVSICSLEPPKPPRRVVSDPQRTSHRRTTTWTQFGCCPGNWCLQTSVHLCKHSNRRAWSQRTSWCCSDASLWRPKTYG